MEKQWLKQEPYVVGDVWRTVKIHRALVPPMLIERTGSPLSSP